MLEDQQTAGDGHDSQHAKLCSIMSSSCRHIDLLVTPLVLEMAWNASKKFVPAPLLQGLDVHGVAGCGPECRLHAEQARAAHNKSDIMQQLHLR